MDANDICCSSCTHEKVCSLKEIFRGAQAKIDDVEIIVAETETKIGIQPLRSVEFIEPVKLRCKHFQKGGIVFRDGGVEIN